MVEANSYWVRWEMITKSVLENSAVCQLVG